MTESALIVFIVVSMIILVIISISVLWFFYYLQNKTIKLQMQEQANKILYQNQLLVNTVKTQETERNRIASELHDDVASRLNVLHLNVHLLKKKVDSIPDLIKIIDQIESSLDESISRTRSISHELMPQVLKKFGFHHALYELGHSVNGTGTINVDIVDGYLCKPKDNMEALHLFRILQELISNTIKYAKASEIRINFEKEETTQILTMHYRDNGIGFNPESASVGLGLYNIKTRAELLEAQWAFLVPDPEGRGVHFSLKFRNNG